MPHTMNHSLQAISWYLLLFSCPELHSPYVKQINNDTHTPIKLLRHAAAQNNTVRTENEQENGNYDGLSIYPLDLHLSLSI